MSFLYIAINNYLTKEFHFRQMIGKGLQFFNIEKVSPGFFLKSIQRHWQTVFCLSQKMVKKGLFVSKNSRFGALITRNSNIQLLGNKWSGGLTREITIPRQPRDYSVFHFVCHNLLHIKIGPKQGIFFIFDPPPSS